MVEVHLAGGERPARADTTITAATVSSIGTNIAAATTIIGESRRSSPVPVQALGRSSEALVDAVAR